MVAPRLLWRYMLRDVLLHTLLGLFAITLLIVVQNVLRFMEDLLAAGVGFGAVVRLVAVIVPSYGIYAIPTALLFGVLISFGRMSADGEIVAMRASGISVPRLLPPALMLGVAAALVTAYLIFELQPRARFAMRTLVRQLAGSLDVIEPDRFLQFGDRLLYVQGIGEGSDCPLAGVLLGDAGRDERSFYVTARCGSFHSDPGARSIEFELRDGSIHFRDPDPTRYRLIRFDHMKTSIDISNYTDPPPRASDLTFPQLRAALALPADDPARKRLQGARGTALEVQLHRRLSFPFAPILLAVIAVPLGIRPLRAGRSMGALTALGVMGLYYVLFSLGEMAAQRGVAPAWLGLWLPNVIVLVLGVWLVRRIARSDS